MCLNRPCFSETKLLRSILSNVLIYQQNATLGYEKIIGDKFRQDQTLFIADAFSAIENVVHRKCAYLGVLKQSYMNFLSS